LDLDGQGKSVLEVFLQAGVWNQRRELLAMAVDENQQVEVKASAELAALAIEKRQQQQKQQHQLNAPLRASEDSIDAICVGHYSKKSGVRVWGVNFLTGWRQRRS
jgi:hypothetical protein